jgi:hypothetical protein
VRQFFIRYFLPACFCLLPLVAAVLVALSVPPDAMKFFLEHVGPMETLIFGLGGVLFVLQMFMAWRALGWRGESFDEKADRWITNLAQAAEWFPMLGLIGTVAGILQTFGSITGPTPPHVIIEKYAPAITATGAGLFMAFINILPAWIVLLGRDVILTLAGNAPPPPGDSA